MPLLCLEGGMQTNVGVGGGGGDAGSIVNGATATAKASTSNTHLASVSTSSSNSTEIPDKFMDLMHKIVAQLAIAQSHIDDSVTLPLPSMSLLATAAAHNSQRHLVVLHILETTVISWQKQIKNALRKQPEIGNVKPDTTTFVTKDEIQLWTSCINKLNNLQVQLNAQHVTDILQNLEINDSPYVQPFQAIKAEIQAVSIHPIEKKALFVDVFFYQICVVVAVN